jgi:hypothetical protein
MRASCAYSYVLTRLLALYIVLYNVNSCCLYRLMLCSGSATVRHCCLQTAMLAVLVAAVLCLAAEAWCQHRCQTTTTMLTAAAAVAASVQLLVVAVVAVWGRCGSSSCSMSGSQHCCRYLLQYYTAYYDMRWQTSVRVSIQQSVQLYMQF